MNIRIATEPSELVSGSLTSQRMASRTPDCVLLSRFVEQRNEEAFELLVRRHGPAVLRECLKWLPQGSDAEDAFQATFAVLVHQAAAVRDRDAIGPWLRGVARRVAGRAKTRVDRVRRREGAAVNIDSIGVLDKDHNHDLQAEIRGEVAALPEKYRNPIELCYWHGLTSEEAAERLDCPTGTLKWRLSRGREILKDRLSRRGLALMALIMFWRTPQRAAASGGSVLSFHEKAFPWGRNGSRELFDPSDDLVQRTLEVARRVRDNIALERVSATGLKTNHPRRKGVIAAAFLLLAAFLFLGVFTSGKIVRGGLLQQGMNSISGLVPSGWTFATDKPCH